MSDSLTVATWNTEWSTPKNERGQRVSVLLRDVSADVFVVTEGCHGLLPDAGDFNQRIPRFRQPIRVAAALAKVFADWHVHTAGDLEHGPHIDHIASSALLTCRAVGEWAGRDADGRLSDHSGVSCRLARK